MVIILDLIFKTSILSYFYAERNPPSFCCENRFSKTRCPQAKRKFSLSSKRGDDNNLPKIFAWSRVVKVVHSLYLQDQQTDNTLWMVLKEVISVNLEVCVRNFRIFSKSQNLIKHGLHIKLGNFSWLEKQFLRASDTVQKTSWKINFFYLTQISLVCFSIAFLH